MSQEIKIPDYLKKMMADGSAVSNIKSTNVASSGVPRISTKGKVFRLKDGDDETKMGQELDVIIIGMNPEFGLAHTYYESGYTTDASDPPDCSSQNGKEPDNWITKPQSKSCLTCPQAAWGSAKSMAGKKSKACKDSKHLFVAFAEEFGKDPTKAKLWLLQVTVNSLKAFSNYGKTLDANHIPGTQFVITRISMNDEASVPQLDFEMLGMLDEAHGTKANARATKGEWKTISAPEANDNRKLESPVSKPVKEVDVDLDASMDDILDTW